MSLAAIVPRVVDARRLDAKSRRSREVRFSARDPALNAFRVSKRPYSTGFWKKWEASRLQSNWIWYAGDGRKMSDRGQRLLNSGADSLSDCELLAVLLLDTSPSGKGTEELSKRLLARLGNLKDLATASIRELCNTSGMGEAEACLLHAAVELGRRIVERPLVRGAPLIRSRQVFEALGPRVAGHRQESFWVASLDVGNRLISCRCVAKGAVTHVDVDPREVYMPLVRDGAVGAIVAHNHPSGDPSPSDDDRLITIRLREAGALLGIPLLDHVILGCGVYYSFADDGQLG